MKPFLSKSMKKESRSVINKLIEWIDQKTIGVHILFIMTFVEHFMTVVFSEVFSVKSTDGPELEDNYFYA